MPMSTPQRAVLLAAFFAVGFAGESTHVYTPSEEVTVWLSKVGPYHNPQEVYSYYALPFCKPSVALSPETRLGGLGEILEGSELQNSDIPINFGVNVGATKYCSLTLDDASAQLLAFAVSNHYWYQMFIDELPVWGMVGEIVADEDVITELESHTDNPHGIADLTYLYTHKNFSIALNGDRVIEVNMTSENAVEIAPGRAYDLSFSVHFVQTSKTFDRRFDRYLDYNFFEHQIHWFSLFNSFMMVVFLCGLVGLILMRTIKADYARYMADESPGGGVGAGGDLESSGAGPISPGAGLREVDDSGWKRVQHDVFRPPQHILLYSALVGTGTQLLLLAVIVILSALAGSLYIDRGAVTQAAIVGYFVTSIVSGFISGRNYLSVFLPGESPQWMQVMFLTASLFPALMLSTILTLNLIAWAYNTTNALSFITVLKILVLWAFVSLPLNIGGTIIGRRFATAPKDSQRTNMARQPRPIPERPWYASGAAVCLLSGLLPFGSIFIETYFVFTSFWNYKFYYVYGFMFAVLVILGIVVSCVTIVATYFFLNAEDHRWHWLSFSAGASPALYVFLYAVYYFIFRTEMSGFLQTAFYFGYTLMGCSALGLVTGTVGVTSASIFVNAIFSSIKSD